MKIELILMKCSDCGSTEIEFDERLGEKCCAECGLVIITGMFEETVSSLERGEDFNNKHSIDRGRLGSVIKGKGSSKFNRYGKNNPISRHVLSGIAHCNMVMANLRLPLNLTERIEKIYMELYRNHVLKPYTLEERGTAIVFYALRENSTPHSLEDVSSEFQVNLKRTKKLIRKINQHYGNRIHNADNNAYLIEQTAKKITSEPLFIHQAYKVMEHFESKVISSDFNKGRCYYAAICVIATEIFVRGYSCKYISERTGFHRTKIGKECKKILSLVGYDSVKQLKGQPLETIGD
jgi:transcription initiation factor TFIIIB Brf1 subunit/transcription initiation factor TFIIB